MNKFLLVSLNLLLFTLSSQPVSAAIVKVCSTVYCYKSIADGVAAASSGDVIEIANGAYFERDIIIDKKLTLVGQSQKKVIIDAGSQGRHFIIADGVDRVAMRSMQLINGEPTRSNRTGVSGCTNSTRGGAICSRANNLTLDDMAFSNNRSTNSGGAVFYFGSGSGYPLYANSYFNGKANEFTISNSSFTNNAAFEDPNSPLFSFNAGNGGAIAAINSTQVKVENVLFSNNSVNASSHSRPNLPRGTGGAIYVSHVAKFISTNNVYDSNSANQKGGAVYSIFNGELGLSDRDTVVNNTSAYGGGLFIHGHVEGSTFSKNKASKAGGAIYAPGLINIRNSTFNSNHSSKNGAAIMSATPTSLVTLLNNTFVKNSSDEQYPQGGVLAFLGVGYTMDHSLFTNNDTTECVFSNSSAKANGINNLTDTLSCAPIGLTNAGGGGVTASQYAGLQFSLGSATGVDLNLANNGGRTLTHSLSSSSNAVDSGAINCITPASISQATPISYDQRGEPRVKYCDIGAFELQ